MFQTKVSVFEKAVILDHPTFFIGRGAEATLISTPLFKMEPCIFFWMKLLPILRRIQRPTTQGLSSHARYVLRILHQHKFHPYRMSLHQDLYGNDFLKRVNFCNWICRKRRTDVSFLNHVLFSDEDNILDG